MPLNNDNRRPLPPQFRMVVGDSCAGRETGCLVDGLLRTGPGEAPALGIQAPVRGVVGVFDSAGQARTASCLEAPSGLPELFGVVT